MFNSGPWTLSGIVLSNPDPDPNPGLDPDPDPDPDPKLNPDSDLEPDLEFNPWESVVAVTDIDVGVFIAVTIAEGVEV